MTANQINYWRLQEDKRSNVAREVETHRTNVSNEDISRTKVANDLYLGKRNAAENERHNRVGEIETNRANLAREAENYRSNLARETENYRSNTARERETFRHNLQDEANKRSQIGLGYAQLAEENRSNLAKEAEIHRSNLADESERHRSNMENESIKRWETRIKSRKTDADIIRSQVQNYNDSQRLAFDKLLSDARTDLTRKQIETQSAKTVQEWARTLNISVDSAKDLLGALKNLISVPGMGGASSGDDMSTLAALLRSGG